MNIRKIYVGCQASSQWHLDLTALLGGCPALKNKEEMHESSLIFFLSH